eukprot:170242-Chlamydomonas_euryale.AAC.14
MTAAFWWCDCEHIGLVEARVLTCLELWYPTRCLANIACTRLGQHRLIAANACAHGNATGACDTAAWQPVWNSHPPVWLPDASGRGMHARAHQWQSTPPSSLPLPACHRLPRAPPTPWHSRRCRRASPARCCGVASQLRGARPRLPVPNPNDSRQQVPARTSCTPCTRKAHSGNDVCRCVDAFRSDAPQQRRRLRLLSSV